ncbi:cytochrome C oxidase subunit IV family protein [Candidatus Poriferisodalis sp.]|uniref:cytochrome C oxidase subunit IV family protein n=1 Tax=Candidatus Poriferisodalis sp. TaxID=3101277 RepID=UPI003B0272CE
MSTATETTPEEVHDAHDDHGHGHGLSDFGYIKVALLLAVLTAAEVMTYFVDVGPVEVPGLLILMVVKFWIVVAYFMHLRFDNKLFTWLFVGGLVLAIAVYAAFATSMVFWTDPAGCDLSPNPSC